MRRFRSFNHSTCKTVLIWERQKQWYVCLPHDDVYLHSAEQTYCYSHTSHSEIVLKTDRQTLTCTVQSFSVWDRLYNTLLYIGQHSYIVLKIRKKINITHNSSKPPSTTASDTVSVFDLRNAVATIRLNNGGNW